MTKKIKIYSDASVKNGWGVAFAFKSTVFDSNGRTIRGFSGSKYSEGSMNTTRAEYLSCVYAVKETFERVDNPQDYKLIVHSDCEYAINLLYDEESDYYRLVNHYSRFFDSAAAFWIPREENQVADSIARSTLEKGFQSASD